MNKFIRGGARLVAAVVALSFLHAPRAAAELSVTSSVAQFVTESGSVSRMYAALDPANQVYLVVWSSFAEVTKGQFLNTSGKTLSAPFQIVPGASGYARVVRGANEFLVTYARSGQRWGRTVKYVNGAPELGPEFFITNVFVDSDAGMAYVPSAGHYLVTSWQSSGGYKSYVTGVKADGTITIPTVWVTEGRSDTASPEIACDPSTNQCLIVGFGDAKYTWGRFLNGATGSFTSSLFTVDSGSLQEDQNIEWNPTDKRYLVAYVRDRNGVATKRVYSDMSADPSATTVITGNYGQLGLSYNAASNSFVATFKDGSASNLEYCWVQEFNGKGAVVSGQLFKVSTQATSGNAAPVVVGNGQRSEFLFVQTRNYTAGDAGVLKATPPDNTSGGGGSGSGGSSGGGTGGGTTAPPPSSSPTSNSWSFDGDRRSDLAVWRPSTGEWLTALSGGGWSRIGPWGVSTDKPVPADYDGDGRVDAAVWRPSTGTWYVLYSSGGWTYVPNWGLSTDVPVPADYDGDGKSDYAVWRRSTGTWYILFAKGGWTYIQNWGLNGDVPVPADYDGDGKADPTIWRPSNGTWYVLRSSGGWTAYQNWGLTSDVPVPGDYDGDRKADAAVWRPSSGAWYILLSSGGWTWRSGVGTTGDMAVPDDYDGDGKTDIAVWRPSTGYWILGLSSGGFSSAQWGMSGDVALSKH